MNGYFCVAEGGGMEWTPNLVVIDARSD